MSGLINSKIMTTDFNQSLAFRDNHGIPRHVEWERNDLLPISCFLLLLATAFIHAHMSGYWSLVYVLRIQNPQIKGETNNDCNNDFQEKKRGKTQKMADAAGNVVAWQEALFFSLPAHWIERAGYTWIMLMAGASRAFVTLRSPEREISCGPLVL